MSDILKVDLHCHTHFSDGKHPADFLIERARENEVTHLAITDHDYSQVHVVHDSDEQGPRAELTLIAGVEISCVWEGSEIHMVGLFVDPENPALKNLLIDQQAKRRSRVAQMDAKLEALGTAGMLKYLDAQPAVALTRSHVADYLVAQGVCKTRQKAFKTHLNKSGKMYVPAQWCELTEAVSVIKAAGGISIIAHPGRYPLNKAKLRHLVKAFSHAGGDALEASYPNIAVDMHKLLVKYAVENELYLSAGSDFHDAGAHWTDIGKYPPLDEATAAPAVWHHPIWLKTC